jgi:long-chain fatty acid transport protein
VDAVSAPVRLLTAVALLAPASLARAGGFAINEQSVVAAGSGGASTARDDDAGAAWYNPAALADGGGWRLGVNLVAAMARLHAADPGGAWRSETEGGVSPLPNLHLAWAGGDWAAGTSVGVAYGGDVRWPGDWVGRHEIVASQLQVARIAPFVGWRRGALRIAGGVHVDLAHLAIERGLDFIDVEGAVAIDLRGAGIGADLSAWLDLGEVDVGVAYKSRTSIAMSGEADFTAPDAFAMRLADQGASSRLDLPDRLAVGTRWRRGALALLADLEVTAWSVNDELVIEFDQEQTPTARQVNGWRSTAAVRAGAEWTHRRLVARGGLSWDPTPTRAERMAPSSPDSTRLGLTLGASYPVTEAVTVDGSYGLMQLAGQTSQNPESLMAHYGGRAHFAGVAVRLIR